MAEKIRVLYVDDEPGLLDIGKVFLEQSGDFAVTTVLNAPDAIRLLEGGQFDAIISDYQMPGMDGIQFLVEVRARFGPTPFILFTGRGREEVVIQAINSGADFYLQKGGDPSAQFAELIHKVRSAASSKRADDALRESEERYRAIYDQSPIVIELYDAVGALVHVNPACLKLFGIENIQAIQNFSLFADPNISDEQKEELRQGKTVHYQGPFDFEKVKVLKLYPTSREGTIWLDVLITTLGVRANSITGFLVQINDITERKVAEEGLITSQALLKTTIDSIPDIIGIQNPDHTIVRYNRAGYEFLHLTPEEVYGRRCYELIGRTRPCEDCATEKALKTKKTGQSERYLPEYGIHLDCRSSPVLDKDGEIVLIVEQLRDITERKRTEDALRMSGGQKTAILNGITTNIAFVDKDLKILWANKFAAESVNKSPAEMVGNTCHALWADPARPCENCPTLKVFETKHSEHIIQHSPDGRVWDERGEPVFDENGNLIGVVEIAQDITERKVAEEAVRASHDQLTKSEADLRIHQVELEMQGEELRKSHLALEESRDKFIDLYDFAPLGYLTLNDKALIEEVNLAGATLLGTDRKKLVNARFRKFIAQTDSEQWIKYFMDVLNRGEKQICTLTLKRSDDSMFLARLESIRIILSDGTPTVRVAISDIKDIQKAEEALRESEEKFRATIGQSMDGILIADGDFNIIEWNAAQTTIYGNTREEMLGKPLWEFQFATMPKEQKSPGLLEKMKRRMLDHRASPDSVWMNSLHDYNVQCGDGPCKTVQISTFPIIFRDSILFGSISRDITHTKRAEDALQESEERYRDIFENSVVGLFQTAPGGRMINVNNAFAHMYGFSDAAEMLAADLDVGSPPYTNPEDRQEVLHLLAEKGRVENYEAPHLKRDGTRFWVSITARTIRNTEGNVLLYEGTIIDITERKVAEEAIRQANTKLTLLSSITRHDISNQLTVLRGYLALLEQRQPDPTLNEYFLKVNTATKRISAMVKFTKEYEEIGVKAPTWQDCHTLVDTAAKQAPLGKVMVKNDLPTGAEVFADPLVVKVFYNLMDNAARYGGKITSIRFSSLESGDDHLIVCEDDGNGVPADEKEKIFERGFGKNTGLGLALSLEILSITGITITETGEPGKGARFEIAVPKGSYRMKKEDGV